MPKTKKNIAELRSELAAKGEELAKLQAERAGLAKQLDAIDRQITAFRRHPGAKDLGTRA